MKPKVHYNLFFLFLLIPAITIGSNWKGKHTKEKTIKKEYTVNSNALLKVNNSYGNVSVITYPGTQVNIEVRIKINGNDLEKVEKRLSEIDVEFYASSDQVSAKTIFNKNKTKNWWNWGSSNSNVNMEINYVIKLPITNRVDLSNNYGSINLDKLEGKAVIKCDYGKITTKELMADHNYIAFDYTNNSYFEYIKSGKIVADYSSYTVAKTKSLEIEADYTKSSVEIAENVAYNCDYGSVNIGKANNVTGNGDYLTLRIGDVYKNVNIKADYGSVKIDNMTSNAGNIFIESDYTGITIGYAPSYHFNFDINLEYASLRGAEEFEFNKKRVESTKKYYQGYYGSGNISNTIKINSDYGSVTFKKN